ncbi:lysine N(6)-hydroxylase/L-ornithine N(5)-oxygenase family protein [Microbacterium karelineae]|uniref:lysine N(6)-hydroxylase/L-ornithine N(5)-oxygenase family protein n=1 Tax=Microbacterium karelineae TaxID=2654283 RepID=UPI0012E9DBA7|nr:SidA/IucD/PvdA family monooxygenase [Microbacterium karelineae]
MTERCDVVGVGFGPSNLALAIALRETAPACRARFFEAQDGFGWHRDMLLPGATLQVNHLKDLATLRNPRSRYTFVNYLQERGRLVDFINLKTQTPTRAEYHDYLEWAAADFGDVCSYGSRVVGVRGVGAEGRIDALEVDVEQGGELRTVETSHLVVAAGLRPRLPRGIVPSQRVWHSDTLLSSIEDMPYRFHRRFAVVGAGQSAAEATAFLHREFPDAEVHAIFGRFGYTPADDSPYANRIFDPATVDEFHGAPAAVRERLLRVHASTNYSVVDLDLIEELYRREYDESVRGDRRLFVENVSAVERAVESPRGVTLTVRSETRGSARKLDVDIVVFATGYEPEPIEELLPGLAHRFQRDDRGVLVVDRDYAIRTDDDFAPAIHLQGGTEHSHGLTSSLLSAGATRAGEIAHAVSTRSAAAFERLLVDEVAS